MSNRPRLTENVFAGECEDLVIFLDLKRDRYFALNAQQSAWYRELATGACLCGPRLHLATRLGEMGLLSSDEKNGSLLSPPAITPAISSALNRSVTPVQRQELPRVAQAVLRAWLSDRTRTLLQLVNASHRLKQRALSRSQPADAEIIHLAHCFHHFSPLLFSTENECRFRSLALLRYLASASVPADWVFGIRLAPFSAHCWVEWKSIVLNDDIDRTREFQPILKI